MFGQEGLITQWDIQREREQIIRAAGILLHQLQEVCTNETKCIYSADFPGPDAFLAGPVSVDDFDRLNIIYL